MSDPCDVCNQPLPREHFVTHLDGWTQRLGINYSIDIRLCSDCKDKRDDINRIGTERIRKARAAAESYEMKL